MLDSSATSNQSFDITDKRAISPATADQKRTTYRPHILYVLFERVASLIMFLVLMPVIFVIMIAIGLDSPGSPIFFQKRIAKGAKRPFWFIKLRTMYTDSSERFPELCSYQFSDEEVSDVKLAVRNDPRVTRVGKFLRRTSLDELPNFWNVVTGEMALVGPRPEMWVMLKYYDENTVRKFSVTPGITGYAQIYGRGDLTLSETIEHDLQYVDEASLRTDIRILYETVSAVLRQRGAM